VQARAAAAELVGAQGRVQCRGERARGVRVCALVLGGFRGHACSGLWLSAVQLPGAAKVATRRNRPGSSIFGHGRWPLADRQDEMHSFLRLLRTFSFCYRIQRFTFPAVRGVQCALAHHRDAHSARSMY
jgi:hypothetical protein